MREIETVSLLVRMGATKSKVREWLANQLIIKTGISPKGLKLNDTFNETSLQIRTAFILATSSTDDNTLSTILTTELGISDSILPSLLAIKTPNEIIKDIAKRYSIPYDLRKYDHFGNNLVRI